MSSTKTAAVWPATDRARSREVPLPEVPQGWALIKVAYNGICGTDLAILHGKHPRATAPLIMGHEISGWVEGGWRHRTCPRRQLVTVELLISCGATARPVGTASSTSAGAWACTESTPPEAWRSTWRCRPRCCGRCPDGVDPRTAVWPSCWRSRRTPSSGPGCRRATSSPCTAPAPSVPHRAWSRGTQGPPGSLSPSPVRGAVMSPRALVSRWSLTAPPWPRTPAPLTDGEGADTTFRLAARAPDESPPSSPPTTRVWGVSSSSACARNQRRWTCRPSGLQGAVRDTSGCACTSAVDFDPGDRVDQRGRTGPGTVPDQGLDLAHVDVGLSRRGDLGPGLPQGLGHAPWTERQTHEQPLRPERPHCRGHHRGVAASVSASRMHCWRQAPTSSCWAATPCPTRAHRY